MSEFNERLLTHELHGEDLDEMLRQAAAERFVGGGGFDAEGYEKAFGKKVLNDSAAGSPKYKYAYNDDCKAPGGGDSLWMPGGAMPPVPPNGKFYQKQEGKLVNPNPTSKKEDVLKETISGAKKGFYQAYTESPIWLRDGVIKWLSKKSKFLDLVTSLYQMGADIGAVQRNRTDYFHDALEMIVNEHGELLAMRIYNDRKKTPFVDWLLEGSAIPYAGRPSNKEDLNYTPGGLIVYKKDCGGEPINFHNLPYDKAFDELGTLKFVTHGEILNKNLDTGPLKNNLKEFTISHFIYKRKDLWVPLQQHNETGEMIYRISLPRGWGHAGFDAGLVRETVEYAVAGAALLHVPFWLAEKGYKLFSLNPTLLENRELAAIFIPADRLITRGM